MRTIEFEHAGEMSPATICHELIEKGRFVTDQKKRELLVCTILSILEKKAEEGNYGK